MSSSYPPYYAYPSAPPLERVMPKPPRMHWGWVLLLTVLTLGLFASVWLLVQAVWIRKMRSGKSTGFWLALANVIWISIVFIFAFSLGVLNVVEPSATTSGLVAALDPFVRLSSIALYLSTVFVMRSELQAEPINIPLGGGATFLFAVFYFQYHLSSYGEATASGAALGLGPAPVVSAPDPVHYPTAAEVGVVLPTQPVPPAAEGGQERLRPDQL